MRHTDDNQTEPHGSSEFAVTRWVCALRAGDDVAATRLWRYLEPRLIELGRRNMRAMETASYDEDDVAQSAFHALCSAIKTGRYVELADRSELWKLLSTIAINKVRRRATYESAERRGGGAKRIKMELDSLPWTDFTAEQSALMTEECERMLGALQKSEVKQVALMKVEGYTNAEIAIELGCTRRSIQRRLDFIRTVWSRELVDCE